MVVHSVVSIHHQRDHDRGEVPALPPLTIDFRQAVMDITPLYGTPFYQMIQAPEE